MEPSKKKNYVSPAVGCIMTVLQEAALITDSALAGRTLFTDGQEKDGYYEENDIISYWE